MQQIWVAYSVLHRMTPFLTFSRFLLHAYRKGECTELFLENFFEESDAIQESRNSFQITTNSYLQSTRIMRASIISFERGSHSHTHYFIYCILLWKFIVKQIHQEFFSISMNIPWQILFHNYNIWFLVRINVIYFNQSRFSPPLVFQYF